MLWCCASSSFAEDVSEYRACRVTSDGHEVEAGDEVIVELGNSDIRPEQVLQRAHSAGATVLCCARAQISTLFGGRRRRPSAAATGSWREKHAPETIGSAPALQEALEVAERVARFDCSVLITGESGTGKELLARAIHRGSPRCKAPFVPVNCPAIPKELVESELFGHAKGAFTGAVNAREGRFSAADGGTIFLDEIGEMDLEVQSKLLRTLQDFEITPVGEARSHRVDVRVIAATNRDLETMSEDGSFRLDLLFRLNVVQIHLPPLRERSGDIGLLLEHHLDETAERLQVERPLITAEVEALLAKHSWRGNIRQLRNLAERLVILCGGRAVQPKDLPASVRRSPEAGSERDAVTHDFGLKLEDGVDLRQALQDLENQLIREAVRATSGNKNQAAKLLGLNRTTLVEKLRRQPELAELAVA